MRRDLDVTNLPKPLPCDECSPDNSTTYVRLVETTNITSRLKTLRAVIDKVVQYLLVPDRTYSTHDLLSINELDNLAFQRGNERVPLVFENIGDTEQYVSLDNNTALVVLGNVRAGKGVVHFLNNIIHPYCIVTDGR